MASSFTWRSRDDRPVCTAFGVLPADDDDFRSAVAESLHDNGHAVAEDVALPDVPPLNTLGNVLLAVTDHQVRNDRSWPPRGP
jgi:hypothetical protein